MLKYLLVALWFGGTAWGQTIPTPVDTQFKEAGGDSMLIERTGDSIVTVAFKTEGFAFVNGNLSAGAMTFVRIVRMPDGSYVQVTKGNLPSCHFYFNGGGGMESPNWEGRLRAVECNMQGQPDINFTVAR